LTRKERDEIERERRKKMFETKANEENIYLIRNDRKREELKRE
jgi:hypothetical protein